jgi:hypothetical protein
MGCCPAFRRWDRSENSPNIGPSSWNLAVSNEDWIPNDTIFTAAIGYYRVKQLEAIPGRQ